MDGTVDRLTIEIQTAGADRVRQELDALADTLAKLNQLRAAAVGAEKESNSELEKEKTESAEAGKNVSRLSGFFGELKKMLSEIKLPEGLGKKLALAPLTLPLKTSIGIFKGLGGAIKGATAPLTNFISRLGRVAKMRLFRAIIKAITAAIKEGVTNIYQYSRATGGSLASSLDRVASATQTFKNAIGAALAPVLEALTPVIERLCSWLTTLANKLAEFFAALTGKSTFTAAVASTAEWGSETKKTTGAVKELKRQLMGFDELNVLSDNSSSGGGGGSSTPDYSSMFEEREVGSSISGLVDSIVNAFKTADFSELASSLSHWLQGGINKASEWIESIDWSGLGGKVEKGITSFFDNADGQGLGQSVGRFLSDAFQAGEGFIGGINWGNLVESIFGFIGDFIVGLDVMTLLGSVLSFLTRCILEIPNLILGALSAISTTIGDLFEEVGLDSIAGFFHGIGESLKDAYNWFKTHVTDPVVQWVKDLFGIHSPSTVFAEIGEYLIEGLKEGIKNVVNNVITPLRNWWTNTASPWFKGKYETIKSHGKSWITNLKNGFSDTTSAALAPVTNWYSNTVSPWFADKKNKFKENGKSLIANLKTGMDNNIGGISTVFNSLKEKLRTPINGIIDFVQSLINAVRNGINAVIRALNKLKINIPATAISPAFTVGFNISEIPYYGLARLANGGLVNEGQLFVAREAGPELVGSYGNKTAVMNNSQIVDAVSAGVASAVKSVMGDEGTTVINIDGKKVFEVVVDRNNSAMRRTGKSPLLV